MLPDCSGVEAHQPAHPDVRQQTRLETVVDPAPRHLQVCSHLGHGPQRVGAWCGGKFGRAHVECLRRQDVPNRRPMHGIRKGLRRSARRPTSKPRPADRKTPDDRPAKSDARVPPDGNVFGRSKRSPCPQVSGRIFRSTAITAKADGDRLGPRFRSAFLAATMASRTIWTGPRVCIVNSTRALQVPNWRLSHTTARSCE
jgi:hypothetical protein